MSQLEQDEERERAYQAERLRTERQRCVDSRAKPKRQRQTLRQKITRTFAQFSTFKDDNNDPEHYSPFVIANLYAIVTKMEEAKRDLKDLDNEIFDTFEADFFTEDEITDEADRCEEYHDRIREVLATGELVVHLNAIKEQEQLNRSLPAGTATSTPARSSFGIPGGTVGPPPSSASTGIAGLKLPLATLPTFSGNPLDWPSFYDRFMAMIDRDTRLGPVQKLEYLKSSLKNEALKLIIELTSIDTNYTIAMELLQTRYDDVWPAIAKHLESMFNFKVIQAKSAKEMRRLDETFMLGTKGLANLGYPFDNFVMVFLMQSKMDLESRELWEGEVVRIPKDLSTRKSVVPDQARIFSFVRQRAKQLERIVLVKLGAVVERVQKKVNVSAANIRENPIFLAGVNFASGAGSSKQSNSSVKEKKKYDKPPATKKVVSAAVVDPCSCCGEKVKMYNCEKFKALSVKDRRDVCFKNRLCYNCFGSTHVGKECKSTYSCKTCKARHHSLLHIVEEKEGAS